MSWVSGLLLSQASFRCLCFQQSRFLQEIGLNPLEGQGLCGLKGRVQGVEPQGWPDARSEVLKW